jgi:anti-sigma factor RsiW
MNCTPWREKLDAYVDGELPEQESAAMDEHMHTCRDCAAEAFRRMQMKRDTRVAALRFTPPPGLQQRIEKSIAPKRRPLAFLLSPALAFAVALVLLVAVSAMVMMMRRAERQQALAQLVDLHVAALASSNPVDVVSTDRHTVKPWFQGKLPFTFNLPELEGSPYKLVGGKVVYFDHRPGAHLIFELRKHELSLFIVQQSASTPAGRFSRAENGFSIESWTANGLQYVIVSDAGANDVHALGELMRTAQQR